MKHWIIVLFIAVPGIGSVRAADDLIAAAQKTGQCKTFVKVIQAAGLTQTIKGSGALTVFAPSDDAFVKLPKDILEELMKPANKAKLASIVLAHIIKGRMMAADAKTLTVTTIGDSRIHLVRDGSSLMYGDANVVKPDLVASNGVIHIIDKVLLPEQEESPAEKKERKTSRQPNPTTNAEWETAQRRDFHDASGKVHASEFLLTDGTTDAEVQIIYFLPGDVRFQVVPNLEGKIGGTRDAVDANGGIAGINGGYFEADLSPLGLLISNGRVIHSAQKAKLLSGVFLVRDGRPQIIRARELASIEGIQQAIQCGPFLVEGGQPASGLNAEKVAARTFIFCCGSSCWGFGTCRSVTLAATGEMLAKAKLIRDFRISQALNLDGGSSTTLYAKLDNHEIFSEGRSIVSNYLIIGTFLAPE